VKETAERLMDLAEAHIRSAGYAGFLKVPLIF
jgi:hypothetical protein